MHCLTLYWGPLPVERVERRCREALAEAEQNGVASLAATAYRVLARVATHQGDLEETLHAGYRQLEEMGGTGPQVNVATMLARVRLLRGRIDEAEELTRICERLAAPEQADAQVKWRSIRAIAMARRGELPEAERLAREAVYLAGRTDQLDPRAEAHLDLAEVLLLGGRGREAAHELDRAIPLFQEKGNEVGERNARRLLARTRS
jgi:tetratricopeptide (TPR) repeat protein